MKWTVTRVAEREPGRVTERPLAQIERGDAITPASLGLSMAEGKAIVAAIQTAMVTAQIQRHGESARSCPHCAAREGRRLGSPQAHLQANQTVPVRGTPGRFTGSDSRADTATADWIAFRKQCRTAGACAAGAHRFTWERDGQVAPARAGDSVSCAPAIGPIFTDSFSRLSLHCPFQVGKSP
jgi:hypothetical protein